MQIRRRFDIDDYIPKPLRFGLIVLVGLVVLVVGAGAFYTWFMGRDGGHVESAVDVPARPAVPGKPGLPPPGTAVGVAVQSISSPILPGTMASITIRTTPTANCVITAKYDETFSTDPGLAPQAADDYGMADWSWWVELSVPFGTWPVEVTCTYYEKSGMVRGDLEVVKELE